MQESQTVIFPAVTAETAEKEPRAESVYLEM